MESNRQREYVVAFRAPSSVRFSEDGHWRLTSVKTANGTVALTFRTRYDDVGLDAKIPRELWIDARGTAPSMNQAINEFGRVVSLFLPMLAITQNAAILDLKAHLAFESTADRTEREFFQQFISDEIGLPRITRKANAKTANAFVQAIGSTADEDRERIIRSCAQYRQALMYWGPGQELLALAHLYMGIEALTRVVLRRHCAGANTDADGLAAQLGVERKLLEPTIRKRIIFQNDVDCYNEAKRASDGFEHGYLGFDELESLARKRRDQTATYLRDAVLDLLSLDADMKADLAKYNVAVGAWKVVRYFRGLLLGQGRELAAPDQEYPFLRWKSSIQKATSNSEGGISITPTDTLSPLLAPGISLKPTSYEMWGPERGTGETAPQAIESKITEGPRRDVRRDKILSILDRINRAVLDYGAGRPFEATVVDAFILAIFAECRSRFRAAVLLLKSGLANEALDVAYGIFRNMTRLRGVTEADKKPLIFGWIQDSVDIRREIQTAAKEAGLGSSEDAGRATLEDKLVALAKEHDIVLKGFPVEPLPTEQTGPLTRVGYWASKLIRDGFGALASYSKPNSGQHLALSDACDDTDQIALVGQFAAAAALAACQVAGQIFGWDELPDLDGLLRLMREATALSTEESDVRTS
jgi:hypothetical protein